MTKATDTVTPKELAHQAALAVISNPKPEEIEQCAEAARELLLRQSEQGKDWGTAIFVLLTYIESGELPH